MTEQSPGRFRAAVESGGVGSVAELLADDVVFSSPVVYKPYHRREAADEILSAVGSVFEDFGYVAELRDGDREVLMFKARVGQREVQGVDIVRYDRDGLVAELTVMIRPLSGLAVDVTSTASSWTNVTSTAVSALLNRFSRAKRS